MAESVRDGLDRLGIARHELAGMYNRRLAERDDVVRSTAEESSAITCGLVHRAVGGWPRDASQRRDLHRVQRRIFGTLTRQRTLLPETLGGRGSVSKGRDRAGAWS